MIRFALPLLILFTLFPSAQAIQLGDRREQVVAQYGKPTGGTLDLDQGQGTYRWNGWRLDVEVRQSVVQRLLFTKDIDPVSEAEAHQLLGDNGGVSSWQRADHLVLDSIADEKWLRPSDGAEAIILSKDHRVICLITRAWAVAWAKPPAVMTSQPPGIRARPKPSPVMAPAPPVVHLGDPLHPVVQVISALTVLVSLVLFVGFVGWLVKLELKRTARLSKLATTNLRASPAPLTPLRSACTDSTAPSLPISNVPSQKTLADLSWQEFELLIGELYRRQGYAVEMCSGDGSDGGVDLWLRKEAETVLVQCKHWKVYKVGVAPVRELYGILTAEKAARAILVTTGRFTQDARDFAAGKPLELIDGERLNAFVEEAKYSGQGDLLDVASWSRGFAQAATITDPVCPFCHSPMVLRRGRQSGNQFWGCSTYPRCRGKRNVRLELMTREVGRNV